MKIFIVGLGSIGQRHVRIMKKICDAEFIYLPSTRSRGLAEFIQRNQIKVVGSLNACLKEKPDAAIISNASSGHIRIAKELVDHQIPFLIEKPVAVSFNGLEGLNRKIEDSKLPVLVGFQLRHHPLYKVLREKLRSGIIGAPLTFSGHVGQYLPDWRPSSDYRKTVSASARLGGGVLSDLCHEIDLAIDLLGPVKSVYGALARISNLEIDTEDVANLFFVHKSSSQTVIHLNYLDRESTWHTRIVGTKGTINWDYGKGVLQVFLPGRIAPQLYYDPPDYTRDELFESQARHWLSVMAGNEPPMSSFSHGCEITRLIVAAKMSSSNLSMLET